ncbi:MAG: DUF3006 domain-containing protein [Eubacteriales bacterium]|nr:DUF3006 domain-containing protein [Eubacteriales bacterium]
MRGIVDRIENGIAVVETADGMLDIPAVDGLQDGDFVELADGQIISIDRAAAEQRRAKLQARLDRMMKKKK